MLNREYFSGNPIDQAELAEGIELWKKQPLSFYRAYILSILDDKGTTHHSVEIIKGEYGI